MRVWSRDTGRIVASIGGSIGLATFASGGRVLVAVIDKGNDHEIGFYDLVHSGQAPRRVPGVLRAFSMAVSPDGALVAVTHSSQVRLFDPTKGDPIEPVLHGHLNLVYGVAFSPDGRRLISAAGAQEAVKLWDIGTRQELLTLIGTGSILEGARWSADADMILVGPPWQAWRAPSWEEIAAAETKEKTESKQP
jgi:WD40 repeat protein